MKNVYKNILLNFYFFLFIFTMVNREYLFFGLDLRFVMLPLGFMLFGYGIIKREYKKNRTVDKGMKFICLFYAWVFISNLSWLWNGLDINLSKFINEMILLINVFVSILNIRIYKSEIKIEFIHKCMIFSCLILTLSMTLVSLGFTPEQISASLDEPYKYVSTEIDSGHRNIYGWNFRPAGYASDPNYATILLVIGCAALLKSKVHNQYKFFLLSIFLFAIGMSFSKTTMLACVLSMLYLIFVKFMKKYPRIIKLANFFLVFGIIAVAIMIPKVPYIKEHMPYTMSTRITMWESASVLFERSPMIGNGITSFRSYFAQDHWYVQVHNTYWQILSELGIIGILLFGLIFYTLLNDRKNRKIDLFITVVFLVFMLDFETIALQFIVYILGLCFLESLNKKKGKKALFMVNSLSNGGAERVCINMADELINRNYQVDFIVFHHTNELSYEVNPKIHIYDLKIKDKNKIKKLFHILISVSKVNHIINENESEEAYSLITSHLPMSNVLTRFSHIKNRAIYVFHSSFSYYKDKSNLPYKFALHYLYGHKKLVTVSKSVRKEAIEDYGMDGKYIKTIYNPISIELVLSKADEAIDLDGKYILSVGRFSKEKRQDRMIDIFYQGKFYQEYKLVFCGTGELESEIKDKVLQLNLQDSVIFLGWQDNIYKWMKNASLVVCTSDHEAFPMTLIEAIVCNTRIVSSNCNYGPNEILIGAYAKFLVEPNHIEEYIEKMNQALYSYPNEANDIVKQCQASYVIDHYLEFMNHEMI